VRPRAYLDEMDLRRIHYHRFGSEEPTEFPVRTYKEVARACRLPITTCHHAIQRYLRDGHKFVDRRRNNFKSCWARKRKIQGPLAEYLLNHGVLTAWAGYSLSRRCQEIKLLGHSVTRATLSRFYRQNKVRYVVCQYQYQQARAKTIQRQVQQFAVQLARRTARGDNIVYFDETSCHMWMRKRTTWSSCYRPVKFRLNKLRG